MATLKRNRWVAEPVSGVPRADRRSCDYDAYVPDPLLTRRIVLTGEVAADVADAEAAIVRLGTQSTVLTDTEALARLLLRAECVASSKIEGLEVGPRRLLRAEAARQMGEASADVTAEEVLGNIDAMGEALQAAERETVITRATILGIHRCLLANTPLKQHAGEIREVQNWIGGSAYNPCSAAFVPPPPDTLRDLLDDLAEFCNGDSLPAIVQAALAHAQFETIHPFVDGNGRTGRALIHLILRRRGLSRSVQPPISLVLATRANDYVGGLTGYRYVGPSDGDAAHEGLNNWVGSFAAACVRATDDAQAFEARCQAIQATWRERVGRVRSDSSVDLLMRLLPGTPILSVKTAIALLNRSKPQVNQAVARLQSAGVLRQLTVGRRNRAFEAREIIDAFADLERQLASPDGNTAVSAPTRPVPGRRD
ncbi:MAG: Fic family protein [Coriobacteriales bacterium]|nr:Fic family protein [Coriobacteriales bacterium]